MDIFIAIKLSIYNADGTTVTERTFYDKDIRKAISIKNKYQWGDTPQFTIYNQDCDITIHDKDGELQSYINRGQIINGDKVVVNLVKRENDQMTVIDKINEYVISDIEYYMASDEVKLSLSDELLYNGTDRYFVDKSQESFYVEAKTGKQWIELLVSKLFPEESKNIVYRNGANEIVSLVDLPSLYLNNDLVTNIIEDFCITFGLVVYTDDNSIIVDRFSQRRGNVQWQ